MGKKWDTFTPEHLDNQMERESKRRPRTDGRTATGFQRSVYAGLYDLSPKGMLAFQLWYMEIMQECLRVLKPGAHLLSFGGTRTYHRMVVAIEDAGFEIRDSISWLYGCLSEDTEILTINGWERYNKNIASNPVLCYIVGEDKFQFDKPTKTFCYENKYPAYRIKSDSTDQLVSRNHRCIIERDGRKVFAYAETLKRQEDVPFLESLRDLPETISNAYEGTSVKKSDLLAIVQRQENITIKKREGNWKAGAMDKNKVCLLQEEGRDTQVPKEAKSKNLLLRPLSIKARLRSESYSSQIRQNGEEISGNGFTRRKESGVERWSNLFQNAWKLCRREICALPEGVFAYGSKGRICDGAPVNFSEAVGALPVADGSRSSQRPQSGEQRSEQSNSFQNEQRTQTIRRTRATVTEVAYAGKVWCVEVPSGAFVGRRNGKIFLTGNSGFPKSLDVSKALDREAGVKRTKTGERVMWGNNAGKGHGGFSGNDYEGNSGNKKTVDITEATTDGAKKYDGWGTALKPAVELICLARKPLSESTIAQNVLKHRTGGLNIDGCRISYDGETPNMGGRTTAKMGGEGYGFKVEGRPEEANTQGRWPANLIIDGSKEVLEGFPESESTIDLKSYKGLPGTSTFTGDQVDRVQRGDSGSAARFFYCAKSSAHERNLGLAGVERYTLKPETPKEVIEEIKRLLHLSL